jgi:hypothetical protein
MDLLAERAVVQGPVGCERAAAQQVSSWGTGWPVRLHRAWWWSRHCVYVDRSVIIARCWGWDAGLISQFSLLHFVHLVQGGVAGLISHFSLSSPCARIPAWLALRRDTESTHQVSWSSAAKNAGHHLVEGCVSLWKALVCWLFEFDWQRFFSVKCVRNCLSMLVKKNDKVQKNRARRVKKNSKFSQSAKKLYWKSQEKLGFELRFSTDCRRVERRGWGLLLRPLH